VFLFLTPFFSSGSAICLLPPWDSSCSPGSRLPWPSASGLRPRLHRRIFYQVTSTLLVSGLARFLHLRHPLELSSSVAGSSSPRAFPSASLLASVSVLASLFFSFSISASPVSASPLAPASRMASVKSPPAFLRALFSFSPGRSIGRGRTRRGARRAKRPCRE